MLSDPQRGLYDFPCRVIAPLPRTISKLLQQENNWSKACYAYAEAVTLFETGKNEARVITLMASVPDLMQRIAGALTHPVFFLSFLFLLPFHSNSLYTPTQGNPYLSRNFVREKRANT